MSTAATAPQTAVIACTVVTMNAAASGDTALAGDRTMLIVDTGSSSTVLTITTTQAGPGGLTIANDAVSISANKTVAIALPSAVFAGAGGMAALSWSVTTNVTWGLVNI